MLMLEGSSIYTISHAIIGYFFLLLTVRVLTRRPGGQLTPFEFVIVFLVGGVIILATVGDDKSITNCVCAIITVVLLHQSVSWFRAKYRWFGNLIDGMPLVLLSNGQWHQEAMDKSHVEDADVMAVARTKGVQDLAGIKYAVLERNGAISIIKAS
jgi:uncharacterized membrane protein YcaP (DUF421 family)